MTDVGNIQSARRDVGGDQHLETPVPKPAQCLFAFPLSAIGVQNGHGMVAFAQQVAEPVGAVLRPAENDDRIVVDPLQQFPEQVGFLVLGDRIDHVLDRLGRRAAGPDLDGLRMAHRPANERFDFRRDRCGKERGVPLARTFFHDAPHVRQKAHVEHAVGFVEHEEFDLVKLARALPQVIEQAARRCDDHIHAGPQGLILPAIADTPVHHRHAQIGEPREIADGGLDLRRQFAGGFQHQNARGRGAGAEL